MLAELKIKVCGMKDTGNIRNLVKCDPDLIGFIFFAGSKRYIRDHNPEIFGIIPDGIKKVGVFVNETVEEIKRIIKHLGLDIAQLHGDETPGECNDLRDSGIPVIKAFRISDSIENKILEDYVSFCDYFLFDTHDAGFGGTGKQFDWTALDGYRMPTPYFLSGGIGPENIEEIFMLNQPALAGLDINSRFETEPGIKDIHKVGHFIQSIRRRQK